jgi:predicted transcriptional regulator
MHEDNEGLNLDYGQVKSDSDEGKMFKSTLKRVIKNAQELEKAISNSDDLPQWCHYKLAYANENIRTIHDYLLQKIEDYNKQENDLDTETNMNDLKVVLDIWNNNKF